MFQRVTTGAVWEERNGYSRALRAGDMIFVTGTTAVGADGKIVAPGDAGAQTRRCYEIIEGALKELGFGLDRMVRSRLFLTDMSQADAVGAAHKAVFDAYRPCMTLIGCASLVHPDMVIEIEAEAWAGDA